MNGFLMACLYARAALAFQQGVEGRLNLRQPGLSFPPILPVPTLLAKSDAASIIIASHYGEPHKVGNRIKATLNPKPYDS